MEHEHRRYRNQQYSVYMLFSPQGWDRSPVIPRPVQEMRRQRSIGKRTRAERTTHACKHKCANESVYARTHGWTDSH
eukprot:2773151-Amphidinium_carterae.1